MGLRSLANGRAPFGIFFPRRVKAPKNASVRGAAPSRECRWVTHMPYKRKRPPLAAAAEAPGEGRARRYKEGGSPWKEC